jgi:hypothetical protein
MPSVSPISAAGVVELRQYTLRPGARAELVRLFERELIEPQEAVGMQVGGVFLDRDDADRFVWFRGFEDMVARRRALEAFYNGPVWARFRDAANATMLDSDDVLLLRATEPARHAPLPAGERPPVGVAKARDEWVTVCVYSHPADPQLTDWLTKEFLSVVQQELGVPVGAYRTEPAENDFLPLPVRSDNVFVWTAAFPGKHEYDSAWHRLEESRAWQHDLSPRLEAHVSVHQYLRLQPTARSQHPTSGVGPADAPDATMTD